ncbi:unnamed protein product [Acanthoscelides obtectus]|uniref:Uncharacterized protein n=1 Tax=Acanthoscelides obtectus TaxID=200917 RepID=A0A9P0KF65_ACAOB|nr:unnamed protein product [Acanthoscelides obtectus]CAK1635767.1 hypothetical protein AOBTE_LOCUS9485 [Acanthoscelides obtectus]
MPQLESLSIILMKTGSGFNKMARHPKPPAVAVVNEMFRGRLISRRRGIPWPPRSPDLTPLDFFSGDNSRAAFTAINRRRLSSSISIFPRRFPLYEGCLLSFAYRNIVGRADRKSVLNLNLTL